MVLRWSWLNTMCEAGVVYVRGVDHAFAEALETVLGYGLSALAVDVLG
jgi:hypothetical protein